MVSQSRFFCLDAFGKVTDFGESSFHPGLLDNLGDLGDSRRRPCNPPKTAGSRNESAVRNTSKTN